MEAADNDLTEVEAIPFQEDAFGTVEDYAMDMFGQLGNSMMRTLTMGHQL